MQQVQASQQVAGVHPQRRRHREVRCLLAAPGRVAPQTRSSRSSFSAKSRRRRGERRPPGRPARARGGSCHSRGSVPPLVRAHAGAGGDGGHDAPAVGSHGPPAASASPGRAASQERGHPLSGGAARPGCNSAPAPWPGRPGRRARRHRARSSPAPRSSAGRAPPSRPGGGPQAAGGRLGAPGVAASAPAGPRPERPDLGPVRRVVHGERPAADLPGAGRPAGRALPGPDLPRDRLETRAAHGARHRLARRPRGVPPAGGRPGAASQRSKPGRAGGPRLATPLP